MVGGGQPGFAPLLYKELIKRPEHQTSEQRQALMRRIRETLFKLIVIIGVCKPLEAIFDIDAITRPEDKDYTFSRLVGIERVKLTQLTSTGKAGSAMRRTQSADGSGRVACTRIIKGPLIMCLRRSETLVCIKSKLHIYPFC
jgi:hypothetical protein